MNNNLFSAINFQATRIANGFAKGSDTPRGMGNSDVKRILFWGNEENCAFCSDGISADVVRNMTNQKAIMRFAQALSFIANPIIDTGTKNRAFEPSTALIVSCLLLSKKGEIDFSQMHYMLGGRGNDETTPIGAISRSSLHKVLEKVGNSTCPTRVSSACGENGFFGALGITRKVGKTKFEITNKDHPFLLAYGARLSAMSPDVLGELVK